MTKNLKNPKTEDAYRRFRPAADILEDSTSFAILLDVPGVKPTDVDVSLDREVLSVTAKRTVGVSEPVLYERRFNLRDGIERDKVNAELKAGVLRLSLPKAESSQPTQIPVKAA